MDEKSFGRAIRRWREKAKMTQRDLAHGVGMAASTLSALENKGQGMNIRIFVRLCRFLEADPRVVADEAYYDFRESLGEEADKLIDRREAGEAAKNAFPSVDEIVVLYDAAENTRRSLFLALLRLLRPDRAVTAFLEDRFREIQPASAPPRTPPRPKGRTPRRPRGG